MGVLHVVATPIGNLEDVTLRALRVIGECELLLAEDTRRVRKLLDRHQLKARPLSLHAHNEGGRAARVIAVLERRREIGLRRATGATRRHIRVQFLVEALLLSAVGGAAGALLGIFATASYSVAKGSSVLIPWYAAPGGFLAAILIGAVAGIYPAIRAARLTPTEALRAT